MAERWIDFRSDTITVPSAGMRKAIAEAEVGDDVFGEDPTVNRLEERAAELLGKQAAIYVPSGTQANQIAVRVHTRSGEEILLEANAHIYLWEAGAPAVLSGVTCQTIEGRRGILDVDDLLGRIQPDDTHHPRTTLVCLENTHNRGGGTIYPLPNLEAIGAWAQDNRLKVHLDGARLLNAVAATGITAARYSQPCDTVSLCFSKGLGAPVGSVLAGTKEVIHEARRVRKLFGGAMRQAGILAAACIYALDHNVKRLADDHRHAQLLARAFEESPGFRVKAEEVETNIVWVTVDPSIHKSAEAVVHRFRDEGIRCLNLGENLIRLVTHLDVSAADVEKTVAVVRKLKQ